MAYTLTLTGDERDAFDWVGHRYNNGDAIADILRDCVVVKDEEAEFNPWYEPGNVDFAIPEHKAWEISELAEQEDGYWPCFSSELADKMQSFIDSIV